MPLLTIFPSSGGSKRNKKSKKRVRFGLNDQNVVHEDEGRYSMEERQDQYYNPQELFQMKRDIVFAKQLLERDMMPAGYCWRGLETLRDGGTEERMANRIEFVNDLLGLQLDLTNRVDAIGQQQDAIRMYATANSKTARNEAQKRGKEDEAAARKIYKNDKIIWKGGSRSSKGMSFMKSLVQGLQQPRRGSSLVGTA